VACIAKVLSASIVAAVDYTVPASDSMDEVELSMRRETTALNFLQDVRDVMMNVGNVCWRGLSRDFNNGGTNDENDNLRRCSERILSAMQVIYDFAAFAVESQLETLLDDKAMLILARLSKDSNATNAEEKIGVATPLNGAMDESYDTTGDGKESKLEEACTLPPLYASIAKPPIILTTLKNLESQLASINTSLNATSSEQWDERLSALIDLECILAGGVASMSQEAQHLFIDKLRKMPLQDQFTDLRSQITQQACKVIIATSYEYRKFVTEDAQLNMTMSHFIECNIPAMLNLCKSGTRLMAAQGMNCMLHLSSVCGSIGYPRGVSMRGKHLRIVWRERLIGQRVIRTPTNAAN